MPDEKISAILNNKLVKEFQVNNLESLSNGIEALRLEIEGIFSSQKEVNKPVQDDEQEEEEEEEDDEDV